MQVVSCRAGAPPPNSLSGGRGHVARSEGTPPHQGEDPGPAVLWFPATRVSTAPPGVIVAHTRVCSRPMSERGAVIFPTWCPRRWKGPSGPTPPPLLHGAGPRIPPRGQRQRVEPEPATPANTKERSPRSAARVGGLSATAMPSWGHTNGGSRGGGGASA